MAKSIQKRAMKGLKGELAIIENISDAENLAVLLEAARNHNTRKVYLCGSLAAMSREYVEQPLSYGWEFARRYVHKFRSPVYRKDGFEIYVKLIGDSWLPGCEDRREASDAFQMLNERWELVTDIPLLSTPAKTGQALLWESLPAGVVFPCLPDGLATLIKANSPQHRIETLLDGAIATHQYDGRWMYASLCTLDRLPIGEAMRTTEFCQYKPGLYRVAVRVPDNWAHIGLLPVPVTIDGELKWDYPRIPGAEFECWASEPELTVAQGVGWQFQVLDGWQFGQGRPLDKWARKLIALREGFQTRAISSGGLGKVSDAKAAYHAAAAVREILNHTIGSFHSNTVEREQFIPESEWKDYVKTNGWPNEFERRDGGRVVPVRVQSTDRLAIYMPHWSAQIWALERARIARAALRCEFKKLVKINGDAIYSLGELPIVDNGNLGQLRLKGGE